MDKTYDVVAFLCYLSAGGAAVREHTAFTILLFTATADSVDNALYIAEFLYNNMRAAIRAERHAAREYFRLIDTRSFYLGFMLGVCDVLEKQNAELERASESYALICRTELAVVDSYIKEVVKPKDVSRETKPPTDLNSFSRGRIRGQKTGIKTGQETTP